MRIKRINGLAALLAGPILLAACDMDLADPNTPNEEDVITTPAGLRQVAIGLQATYASEIVNPIYIAGLVTDEIGAIPQAFESYRNVDGGLPVENNLGPSTETWSSQYRVVQRANVLLDNVPRVDGFVPGTESGITALAKFYKAMAFGNLLQVYERVPLEVGVQNESPSFASRADGLARVLELLGEARQQLEQTPPSDEFTDEVLAPGFDLANTIDAMIARYSLIAGELDVALAAAERVDLGRLSELRSSEPDPSSLWNMWLNSGNAFAMRPKARFRLEAEEGDGRVGYWVAEGDRAGAHEPLDDFVKYAAREAHIPAYLPDEMRLIQAEVHARRGNLSAALDLVNEVRTRCSSPLDEPSACLPALAAAELSTQADMLRQILHERRYSLYLQGVRWSDLRRFEADSLDEVARMMADISRRQSLAERGQRVQQQRRPAERVCTRRRR
jgi:starch-binding outer membrane protein, SusD/RagB family